MHSSAKRGPVTVAICMVSVLAVWLLGASPAGASPLGGAAGSVGTNLGGVSVIAQRGFGDTRNSYAWSMAWFDGKLYVGTARQELCVELVTIDYYLPVAGDYTTNPEPGVHCPANPDNLSLRAEIWQYTPQTRHWQMVYISPLVRNPHDPRKMVARDLAYRGMVVYHDAQGRPELYVGAVTPDEFLPELKRPHPPVLLRTTDGIHFTSVGATNALVRNPFGINRPMGMRSMLVWNGKLFVTLTGGLTGDGEVYEVDQPWSSHATFRQVSPASVDVFEMHVFDGRLYIGTGARVTGYGVYWTTGQGRRWAWHPVVTNGGGRGDIVTSVVSMTTYGGELYVGSSGWYSANTLPVSELIRVQADGSWQVVAGAPRTYQGVRKAPISGLTDGFDNIFAAHFWRMASYGGALYVGTNDWSWLLQRDTHDPWLQSILSPEFGFDVWATCDGADWFPVTRDAFGNMDDFGARNFIGSPFGLFIGSADHAQGTRIFLDTNQPCSSLVNGTRASAARAPTPGAPQQLLTDVQRRGTVLSWNRSPYAARYEVFRSAYDIQVPFTYQRPATLPGGFRLEDAVPMPAQPGSPNSIASNLLIPGSFTPVGSTRRAFFVDHSAPRGVRMQYQVVAIGLSGTSSAPSNLQVVPDPRPPATFGQLEQAMRGSASPVATTAVAGWLPGDRTAELSALARLLRNPRLDPGVRELAERLQRRIMYGGVAGGP